MTHQFGRQFLRLNVVLFGMLISGLFAKPAESFGLEQRVDRRQPEVRPFQLSTLCLYDRVMIGPNGVEVAVWPNDGRDILSIRQMLPPSDVIVGRMNDPIDSSEDRLFTYGGAGLRLFPIRWSRNGDQLYVRVREPRQRILSINAEGKPNPEEIQLALEWNLTDISAITHGDTSLLADRSALDRVKRVDGKEFIRGRVTLGSTAELVGARRADLSLVRIGVKRAIGLGINSGHTRLLTVFPHGKDYRGGISYLGAPRRAEKGGYLPYQLPIVDLETGNVAGTFGLTQMRLDQIELKRVVDALILRLNADGGLILDASLSGDTLLALVSYRNGNRKLFRLNRRGLTEKLICTNGIPRALPRWLPRDVSLDLPPSEPLRLRIFALDKSGRETTREGGPILIRFHVPAEGTRDAVLYFRGGPGGTLADDNWNLHALKLLRPNRDIIAVEYSGSLGGGNRLTRRLAKDGMDALRQDVDRVASWLTKRKYRKVYLLAGSFGGVPAMVALARHRPLFSDSFLIAPVLKLQDPERWTKRGGGLRSVSADTQLAYELASFGGLEGRKQFANALYFAVAEAKLGENDHLYFGELDDISKRDHLPNGTKPKIVVFPRTGHAVLGARSELWRDIEDHMK